jgi:hypothetical protein
MKFLADRTLGKLVKGLRMLGYDTLYYRSEDFHQLIHLARQEDRVILTRDTKLAVRRPNDRILTIMENNPSGQLKEVIQKGCLSLNENIFYTRCLLCNEQIEATSPDQAEGKVPDFIFHQQKDFFRCPRCDRIYWQGSHLGNMQKKVDELLKISAKYQVPNHK